MLVLYAGDVGLFMQMARGTLARHGNGARGGWRSGGSAMPGILAGKTGVLALRYIEVKMPNCIMYFTAEELNNLLAKDIGLWTAGLKRGKAFIGDVTPQFWGLLVLGFN